jgi:membrane protease YdiL (CAAX protease family)
VHPIAGYISFRRLMKRIDGGLAPNRMQLYKHTIMSHWALFVIAILVWNRSGRPWAQMGVSTAIDWSFFTAALLTLAAIGFLIFQVGQVMKADQPTIDRLARKFGRLEPLIPHTGHELSRFYAVSLSAGVVEEILWRGFLIAYLTQFLPLLAAATISAAGFGLAHAYQGTQQVPRIALVGAVFVVLYLMSGTIWLPIVLHTAMDILQGRLAYEIAHRRSGNDAQPVSS